MTGFSKNQLIVLVRHLRTQLSIRDTESRRVFDGTETLLNYLVYNRLGVTKLQMSLYYFGRILEDFLILFVQLVSIYSPHFIIKYQAIQ